MKRNTDGEGPHALNDSVGRSIQGFKCSSSLSVKRTSKAAVNVFTGSFANH